MLNAVRQQNKIKKEIDHINWRLQTRQAEKRIATENSTNRITNRRLEDM